MNKKIPAMNNSPQQTKQSGRYIFLNLISFCVVCFFVQNVLGQQPKITSFAPTSGSIGTMVTINGSGFSAVAASSIVYFGAVKAEVSSSTETTVKVKVPYGATFEPISVTSNSLTAYSSKPFAVTFIGTTAFIPNSFATPVVYESGKYPVVGGIGDFDGDGKPDIITANYTDNTVSVFRNNSSNVTLSFLKLAVIATGEGPGDIAIADFDCDGMLDFAVSNTTTQTVSVFRNISTAGSIKFASKIDLQGFKYTIRVSAGDFDGDGKPDIAEVDNIVGDIYLYRNTSTPGNLSFTQVYPFIGLGEVPSDLAVGDLDNDGKPDLAITEPFTNTLHLLKNITSGEAILFDYKLTLVPKTEPNQVSMADLDGDGNTDIIVCSSGSDSITVFQNKSTAGNYTFIPRSFKVGTSPNNVSIGDLDGDGKPDLAVSSSEIEVKVLRNTSSGGNVSFAGAVGYFVSGSSTFTCIGDLNADGRPDLVVGNYMSIFILKNETSALGIDDYISTRHIKVYPNPGKGIFSISSPEVISTAKVTGIMGNTLATYSPETRQFVIDLSEQPSGTYFLSIKIGNQFKTVQLIKQ